MEGTSVLLLEFRYVSITFLMMIFTPLIITDIHALTEDLIMV